MYGCAGVVRLLSGYYLVVLTSCCFVERILGRAVFKATNFGIIRCSAPGSFHAMSKQHKRDEARYLHLLRASLVANTKHLYFVHGHDMSRNCQSQYLLCRPRCSIRATLLHKDPFRSSAECEVVSRSKSGGETHPYGLNDGFKDDDSVTVISRHRQDDQWSLADKSFCWNRYAGEMLDNIASPEDYMGPSVRVLLLPLICGSFDSFQDAKGNSLSILARTSISRFGIRHHCRGSNGEGEVANFVESEQILHVKYDVKHVTLSSFVMVRGSVPLRWSQPLRDLSWNPKIIFESEGNFSVTQRHFANLISNYGRIKVIDLLSCQGEEGMLKHAFRRSVSALPNQPNSSVQYFHFDLHRETSDRNTVALESLTSWTKAEVSDLGQFMLASDLEVSGCETKLQNGIFRVNCKDCLDRTNLVQSIIARSVLQEQMRTMTGIDIDFRNRCKGAHKVLWADHGDRISSQYAGTLALRRDLTRTGKRTFRGLLQDARTSLKRYCRAKLFDGNAQGSLDLWTSQYLPRRTEDAHLC